MHSNQNTAMGVRQWLALAIGLVTLGVTVGLMLDDISHGAAWTIEHTFGLALLFCIPAAGLVGRWAFAHGERGAGVAFIAAAILGSLLVVYISAGRQHETRAEAQASATNANGARAALEGEAKRIDDKIDGLKAELSRFAGVRSPTEMKGALDAVVGNGPGKVSVAVWRRTNGCAADQVTRPDSAAACEPVSALRIENGKALEREALRRRLDVAESERATVVGKLEAVGGERVVPSRGRAFAEFMSLFGLSAARVEFVVARVDLIIRTLFLEGLTIVAFEYALASIGRPRQPVPTEAPRPVTTHADASPKTPTPPKGPSKRRVVRKHEARADVLQFRRPQAQADLPKRWNVSKSMVSQWLGEWENEGIVLRQRAGRTATVQAAVVNLHAVA